ncbi:MAG: hypothetical protein LBU60_00355 [Clostridiales bacterium]|jgi:hypothetical protein|nr:hypothetical protein [Clostridiales bacterium]
MYTVTLKQAQEIYDILNIPEFQRDYKNIHLDVSDLQESEEFENYMIGEALSTRAKNQKPVDAMQALTELEQKYVK